MTEVNQSVPSDGEEVVDEYGFRPEQDAVGEGTDGIVIPPDEPLAATDFGTTVRETLEGESLDGRLSREVPDLSAASASVTDEGLTGALVDADAGAYADTEKDAVAYDAGSGTSQSAEEAAMHVIPE